MLELVFAMAIFVLLSGCFYSVASSMKKYRDKLELESEAISVLDNLTHRISSERNPSTEKASLILADEFKRSPLALKEEIKARLEEDNDGHILAIIRNKDVSIAEIRFGK